MASGKRTSDPENWANKIIRRYEPDVPPVKQYLHDGDDRVLIAEITRLRAENKRLTVERERAEKAERLLESIADETAATWISDRIRDFLSRSPDSGGEMGPVATDVSRDDWPEGISDGLSLPCSACGMTPCLDYTVSDATWRAVVPEAYRLGIVCLPCLDQMAVDKGIDISEALERVQFIGIGKTIVLNPIEAYRHSATPPASAPVVKALEWRWNEQGWWRAEGFGYVREIHVAGKTAEEVAELKAAAQADYEQRIRSALAPRKETGDV